MHKCGKIILKKPGFQRLCLLLCSIFTFCLPAASQGQVIVPDTSSLPPAILPVSLRATDTLRQTTDSIAIATTDTSAAAALAASGIVLSPDALESPVTTFARDSAVVDLDTKFSYLYGTAKVTYQDLELNAASVRYNQATNTVTASPLRDSTGAISLKPTFQQGTENFDYDSLQYNFRSKRALVVNATSKYGEGFIHSELVKRNADQSIFGRDNIYTTCNLPHPHFGIHAGKIKVVPGKIAVSGAANLEIEDVPTPLYLPFGIFPITQKQRSGIKIPSYTIEQRRGLGLTNGGYYFHFNDYVDLLATGNVFTNGSYNLSLNSSYSNRYHYNGQVGFLYSYFKNGESYEPGSSLQKDFAFTWDHRKDPKSKPGVSFNTHVNVGTSTVYANNSYDVNKVLNNQFQSNITYSKAWAGKPYLLTIAALHNQNTQTRQVSVTLPQINFNISQFSPFQSKARIGPARWYEKITAAYAIDGILQTTFIDSTFSFNTLAFKDFQKGIHHSIPVSASYTALRFLNVNFGINYNEYWLTDRTFLYYNYLKSGIDTLNQQGFFATRDFNASAAVTTRIYGQLNFKSGKVAGIRHVLTPSVGLNYTPDFASAPFNYAYQAYNTSTATYEYRSPYLRSVVGVPGNNQFGNYASTLSFGLNNNLQMKTRSGKDSTATTKNISLIDGFSVNSNYNLAADSFNLGNIGATFRTSVLNILNVSANASFDAYTYDRQLGRRVPKYLVSNGGGLARFTNGNLSLGTTLNSALLAGQPATPVIQDNSGPDQSITRLLQNGQYNNYVDFAIPWNLNISYALTAQKNFRTEVLGGDTLLLSQNMQFAGDFNLTPRWKIGFSSGYNFDQKELTITSIDLYRDLHCWEMRLHAIPFGQLKSFNFSLNVKASVLQDLKLVRRRDYRDAL